MTDTIAPPRPVVFAPDSAACFASGSFDSYAIPLFSDGVQAGFPSPAEDHIETQLSLDARFIMHPEATFFTYARGDSMQDGGIFDGDLLLVDRSLQPLPGKVVIAIIDGEFTVKRMKITSSGIALWPDNPFYAPITIYPHQDFEIWGVVTCVIRPL